MMDVITGLEFHPTKSCGNARISNSPKHGQEFVSFIARNLLAFFAGFVKLGHHNIFLLMNRKFGQWNYFLSEKILPVLPRSISQREDAAANGSPSIHVDL